MKKVTNRILLALYIGGALMIVATLVLVRLQFDSLL